MLKIYDKDHNAIGHIVRYKDLRIERDAATGDRTLSFTYLARHHRIEPEYYVETQEDEYVVKEKSVTTDGFLQFVCALNLEGLEAKPWGTFSVEDSTIEEAARLALAGTGWTVGECTVTKRRNAGMLQVTSLNVIEKLCTAFMCERVYDTKKKTVSFYESIGEDKGVYFMRGLNLRKLSRKSDSYDYYTRIIPIGADGLTIEEVNDGKDYLENHQYSAKAKTYIWKDETYTDAQALKEDGERKLRDMSKPFVSYGADIIDLARQNPQYSILSFREGDTVTLVDAETGIREKQRIVKLVQYPGDHSKDTCELANTALTFEELQRKQQEAAEVINTLITGDGRYTGKINVSDILHFENGLKGSPTVGGLVSGLDSLNGELDKVKLAVGSFETNYLRADEADLKYATVARLDVTDQTVHSIQGDYASFKSTVTEEFAAHSAIIDNISGEFSSYKTQMAQELIAAKGWMLEGSIGDAQISNVAANKLSSGTIDTALVTVAGSDGRLQIIDNTIQISDSDRVRVQIGKDGSGDYTLAVWDSSGNLIWDALGATENTIQRKVIRDKMVADDAAIQALKLDLQSFNTALTDQGVSISGTVVQVGNKTLNVALTEQTQLITDHGEALTDHAARITANENAISLKVSTREYESYQSTVNNEIATAKSRLSTAESSITALNGQIALKVSQTDIDEAMNNLQVGGRNLIVGSSTALVTSKWVGSGWGGLFTTHSEAERIYRLEAFNGWNAYRYILDRSYAGKQVTLSFKAKNVSDRTTATADYRLFCTNEAGTNPHVTLFLTSKETAQDVWVDISVTVTLNEDAQIGIGTMCGPEGSYLNAVWLIKDVKLEVGSKATDWTPAPEDIDSSINAVDAKFADYSTTAQMQSEINLAKDSITQSVSATYATKASVDTVSGNVTNLTSRVQTAESKLTKEGLTTIVGDYYTTASYVGSAIDGIEIGGRNLVANTAPASVTGWVSLAGWTLSLVDCARAPYGKAVRATNGSATSGGVYKPPIDYTKMVNGQKYTISAWIRASKVCTLNFKNEMMPSNNAINVTTSWQKYTFTSAINTGASHHSNVFYVTSGIANGMWIEIHSLKLEKGTKATDWEPAPEDMESSIASVQAIATQAADKFNWLVKSGTSATDFTLTDRTATLIAQTISLNGDVKVNGDMLVDGAVTANKIATDAIKSRNYAYLSGDYSTAGTFFDLSNGAIRSKNFAIKSDGSVYMNGMLRSYSSGEMLEISDGIIYGKRGSTVDSLIDTSAYYADGYYLVLRNNNGKIILQADEVSVEGTVSAENFDYVTTTTADIGAVNTSYLTVNQWIDLAGPANITRQGYNSSWVRGRDYAIIQETSLNGYSPVISIKTNDGSWDIGSYDHAAYLNKLAFTYVTDDDHAAGNNRFLSQVLFNNDGTIDINTAASGGITITNTISEAQVNVVGSQSGRLVVSAAANFGIYSATHSKWLLKCAPDGTVITAATSDRRKKNDYGEMDRRETLAILRNTTVHEFSYKADKNGIRQYGIMAQELRDALIKEKIGYRPIIDIHGKGVDDNYTDLHHPEEDVEYGIDYTKLVPVLHDGWRYHDETIRSMQSEIISIKRIASKDQAKITSLDVRLQGETTCLRGQISSLQYQLQQAFTRIAEQDKLIKQLQSAG